MGLVEQAPGLAIGHQFLQKSGDVCKALKMEWMLPPKAPAESGSMKRCSRSRPGDTGSLERWGCGWFENGVPLVPGKAHDQEGALDAFHEGCRECVQGMGFGAACLLCATAKNRGDLSEMRQLTLLISVHGDEDPQRFFRRGSVQPTKWMRVPMFVVHGELPMHVSLFPADPVVVTPFTVDDATEGFIRCKFPSCRNKASRPAVKRTLELGDDVFPRSVGVKRRDQIGVIDKAKADWVEPATRDSRGKGNAMARAHHHVQQCGAH